MIDVVSRHGRSGDVLFISPTTEILFGAPAQELLGRGLFDRVHVADRPAYLTALADAAALGEPRTVEFRVRRDEQGRHPGVRFAWIELRCRPLDNAATPHEQPELVAVMRDITGRRLQEQATEEAQAEAERAHLANSRFLATMSHELRTPLNAMIGFSDLLMNAQEPMLDAARCRDYARVINESGMHLLAVVNGMLDMSKLEAGDCPLASEPFDPRPVVQQCYELF